MMIAVFEGCSGTPSQQFKGQVAVRQDGLLQIRDMFVDPFLMCLLPAGAFFGSLSLFSQSFLLA